jgi:TRAP-type C4-dicarboxylate transport system substrate-binding protein
MRFVLRVSAVVAVCIATAVVSAQTMIKLGTAAPARSVWSNELNRLSTDARTATGGRVSFNVYAGTQGDEFALVRRMRLGQLQAAALSSTGLAAIDDAFNLFSIPLFFQNDEETAYVIEKIEPLLRARLEKNGFVLLGWGHGGWVQIFSKEPIRTLDEMKQAKLFTAAGDDRWVQWYKKNGFNPVPLAPADLLTQLQTNGVTAVPATPLLALAFQWYERTPYMLDAKLGPVIGATVMPAKAWNALSEPDRDALNKLADQMEQRLQKDVPRQDAESIAAMEKKSPGLKIIKVAGTPAEDALRKQAESLADAMETWPAVKEILGPATAARDEFRKKRPAK